MVGDVMERITSFLPSHGLLTPSMSGCLDLQSDPDSRMHSHKHTYIY